MRTDSTRSRRRFASVGPGAAFSRAASVSRSAAASSGVMTASSSAPSGRRTRYSYPADPFAPNGRTSSRTMGTSKCPVRDTRFPIRAARGCSTIVRIVPSFGVRSAWFTACSHMVGAVLDPLVHLRKPESGQPTNAVGRQTRDCGRSRGTRRSGTSIARSSGESVTWRPVGERRRNPRWRGARFSLLHGGRNGGHIKQRAGGRDRPRGRPRPARGRGRVPR